MGDWVEMTITPSPNLPTPMYTVAKYLDTILKASLVEYMAALPAPHVVADPKVKVVIDMEQRTRSLNMVVTSPMDITQYKNIRVPRVIRNILPVTVSKSPMEQLYKGIAGTRLYSKCSVFQGQIKTFDSMTYSYGMDDCYHHSHAVLAKNKDNVKHVIFYHEITKIELKEAASRYQSSRTPYEIWVDGERKEVRPEE